MKSLSKSSGKISPWKIGALAVVALAVIAAFVFGDPKGWLNSIISYVEKLGPWGPVVFVAVYVVASLLMVPGSALTLGAGAVFGVLWGTALVSLASTLTAAAAFLIGRYLARGYVETKAEKNPNFKALDRALSEEDWKIVALARLSPVFPFTVLNYAFGVTNVKFWHYLLASWIAMLPGTVVYVYLGSLAHADAKGGEKSPLQWAMYGVGLVATVAVTVLITRRAKRALHDAGVGGQEKPKTTRRKKKVA